MAIIKQMNEGIPDLPKYFDAVKPRKQWVNFVRLWNPDKKGGKGGHDKPPINPYTLRNGNTKDPTSWSTYDEAAANIHKTANHRDLKHRNKDGTYPIIQIVIVGVGLVLADGYCGVDFDDVFDENGNLLPWAAVLIERLDTYTEISPSGKGLHCLLYCPDLLELLQDFGKQFALDINGNITTEENKRSELEIYFYVNGGRYFTVTGNVYRNKPINETKGEELRAIYEEYCKMAAAYKNAQRSAPPVNSPSTAFYPISNGDTRTMIDSALKVIDPGALDFGEWAAVMTALKVIGYSLSDAERWSSGDLCGILNTKNIPANNSYRWNKFSFKGGDNSAAGVIINAAKNCGWSPADAFDDETRAEYGRSLYTEEERREYGRMKHAERLEQYEGRYQPPTGGEGMTDAAPDEIIVAEENSQRRSGKDPGGKPEIDRAAVLASVKTIDEIEEEEVEWLLPGYLPRGEINILAAEGGSGKGFVTAALLSGITRGKMPDFFKSDLPFTMLPCSVLYLSSEDDASKVLRPRLRKADADLSNIRFIDRTDPVLQEICFSDENGALSILLEEFSPDLVVFDPIQSFLPDRVRMDARNQMRNCINHLSVLSGIHGTTFLIFCHTNKRDVTDARKALADSADIWDIARSIMFTGSTGENDIKYFSQEKANYSKLAADTILYKIVDPGRVEYYSKTHKHFRDFEKEKQTAQRKAEGGMSTRESAKVFIVQTLKMADKCEMLVNDLDAICEAADISSATRRRAKADLSNGKFTKYIYKGFGDGKKTFIKLVKDPGFNTYDLHNLTLEENE